MAIEEPAAAAVEGGSSKGGMMKWIIIGVVAVLLLGGGAFAYLKFFSGHKAEEGATEETQEQKAEKAVQQAGMPGTMFPLDSFIVNLAGSEGKRFLKITLDLELDKAEAAEEAKARLPQVKDSILVLLSSKTFEEVYTVQGKFKLRDEIISRTNSFLKSGKVKNIYFTEFVIQ
jgi:flagellar FliL protein